MKVDLQLFEQFKSMLKNKAAFDDEELALFKEFKNMQEFSSYIDNFATGFITKLSDQGVDVEDYINSYLQEKDKLILSRAEALENNVVDLFEKNTVRPMEKGDIDAASELIRKHYELEDLEIAKDILQNSMGMEEFNHGIFVYEDVDIKGVMIVDTGEIFRTAEIRHFAVERNENFEKTASAFLKGVIEGIRAEGKYKLYIKVPFENKEDLIFFIKENFIPETCLWNHLMYKEHAILFSKEIG